MGNKNGKLKDKILSKEKDNYSNNFDNNENINQKYNQMKNEIIMTIKIDKNDINKDIYFIDDIDYENDDIKIKNEHNKLLEMNELNTELYINDIKYKFQKYFKFENTGEYKIKIKLNFLIKDCGFMFYNCKNITNIDLSNFNTKNVTNMQGMFAGCKSLKNLNLSNFNTQNVTNMWRMFSDCSSLKEENIITNDKKILNQIKEDLH